MASPTGSAIPSPSSSKSDKDPAATLKKIGKYEIQKKIGAGGMGTVYLALDPFLKRNCALKVLPQEKAKNPTLIKRFRSEAQQAANLRHENIVTVYEAGEADGYSYIAMEYVEGTDVANLVQRLQVRMSDAGGVAGGPAQRGQIPAAAESAFVDQPQRHLPAIEQLTGAIDHSEPITALLGEDLVTDDGREKGGANFRPVVRHGATPGR